LLSVLTPVSSAEKLTLQAPGRRFTAGLMINESCKHLLITVNSSLTSLPLIFLAFNPGHSSQAKPKSAGEESWVGLHISKVYFRIFCIK
jgi:hypothetical protein